MKISIIKFLNQLKIHLILISTLSIIILLLNSSQNLSVFVLQSLYKHQEMAGKLNILDSSDPDYKIIEFQTINNQITFNSTDIKKVLQLDLLGRYLQDIVFQKEQIDQLERYSQLYRDSIKKSLNTHIDAIDENKGLYHTQLDNFLTVLIQYYNHMLFQKDTMMSYLLYFTAFYILLLTLIYYSKIAKSVKDFEAINAFKPDYEYKTKELHYLFKSLNKTVKMKQAEIYLDPLTKLNNTKGILNKYANKQIAANYKYCVYLFSIDNYKAINEKIPKGNSQSILKKIAFIVSLYEKGNDYVARVGYDEFAIILPRIKIEEAFDECERLRKTIEETVFNFAGIDLTHITVSGVFLLKPKDKSLDETLKYGIHFLKTSNKREVNKTYKILGF